MYQSFVISGAILLLFLIALFVGIIPGIYKVIDLFSENVATGKIIKTLQNKGQVLESLDSQTLYMQSSAAISAIPADKSLGTIFSTIDALVSRENAVVTSVSLGQVGSVATESAKTVVKDGVSTIPFTIVVEGSIDKIRNILDGAVKIRRFFRVTNFDLRIDPKNGVSTSTLTMESYYAPITKSSTKPTDALTSMTSEENAVLDQVSAIPLLTPQGVSTGTDATSPENVPLDPFSP